MWIIAFLPDAKSQRFVQRWWQQFQADGEAQRHIRERFDQPEPVRVADGIPHRVDRNTSLGNAVIPEIIGKAILEAEKE